MLKTVELLLTTETSEELHIQIRDLKRYRLCPYVLLQPLVEHFSQIKFLHPTQTRVTIVLQEQRDVRGAAKHSGKYLQSDGQRIVFKHPQKCTVLG